MNIESEAQELRRIIEDFLGERLADKMKQLEKQLSDETSEEKKSQIRGKIEVVPANYERTNWLSSAAGRVRQLQYVHFAAKFSNPSSKASSLLLQRSECGNSIELVSSGSTDNLEADVVCNAADLDVNKFLSLKFEEKSILERCREKSPALCRSFSDDSELATQLLEEFAAAIEQRLEKFETHQFSKQVYFPVGDSRYHLLAPMFPSSLVHKLYCRINEDRFSESAKKARKLARDKRWFEIGYSEYPNLTIQQFGGTKPQNISQLNSARKGGAYLLFSCPPHWKRSGLTPPQYQTTIFGRWLKRFRVLREQIQGLRDFLERVDYNNIDIRNARAKRVNAICHEVLEVASMLQAHEPGWTSKPDCELHEVEQFWLDPFRSEADPEFAARRIAADWEPLMSHRFANWLNRELTTKKQVLGDSEHREWREQIAKALSQHELEVF